MSIECVVVDAGARYGLHPTWEELRSLAQFHLFEMDHEESKRLERKYREDNNVHIYPMALYSSDCTLKYRVSVHRGLNSVFTSNHSLLRESDYKQREFAISGENVVEARSVDSLFEANPVHFMKLDVEGAEYEVLQGAKRQLKTNLLAVRSEVMFAPIYNDAPLFGDIHRVLLAEGFELLNIDYTGAGNKTGRYTLPSRYGKLLSSDAVWTLNNERLFSFKGKELTENIIRLSLFLMYNNATDIAIDVLTRAVNHAGINLAGYHNDPLFIALHKQVLLLFKSLIVMPMFNEVDIMTTYREIFGQSFPLMNAFYESPMFT